MPELKPKNTHSVWLNQKKIIIQKKILNNKVRTGRARACMELQQFDDFGPFTWDDNKLFYPIHEQVMQQNPGKIIQNKGYVQK